MPVLERSLREEISGVTVASYEGQERIFANVPIRSIGWSAGAGIRKTVAMKSTLTTIYYHGAVFSVIFFLAFMVAVLISRTISSPVERLRVHALALGSGEFDKKIDLPRPAEMRTLAQTFNVMARQIDESRKELREKEQRWATTLASIGDAVIATDTMGRLTFMNAAAEELTGWTPCGASMKPVVEVFNIINEHSRQKVENPVAKVLEKGNIVGLANHTVLVRKDGTEIPIDNSGAPIRGEDGKIMGVVLVFHDITRRRQIEKQLKDVAEKYSTLFNTTSDGVWIHNLNGEILEINDAYCRMSGYSRDELTNMPISKLEAIENPEEVANHIKRVIETGGHDRFESRHRRKDGSTFDVDITAFYFERDEGRMAIFVRDITERKRAEVVLRESQAALQNSHDELEQRVQERTAELAQALGALEAERQRFHDVLNMLPAYVILLASDYRVPFANRFFEERFGKSEGRRCYEYLFSRTEACETCESYRALKTSAPHRWVTV